MREARVVLRATIPTEARSILQLVKSAGPRVHVAFEEGTQAQWLHDLVVPHAEKVIVCNTRGREESGNKNASPRRRGAFRATSFGITQTGVPWGDERAYAQGELWDPKKLTMQVT